METQILPAGYLEHRNNVLEAGKNIHSAATTFALTLVHAHEALGDHIWQLIADVAPHLEVKEKTIRNYLGTMENAIQNGWHVPMLSVGHHTAVDSPKLETGEKESLLSKALENELSVGETRALCRSYMEERGLIKEPELKERDNPLFELNEEIERLNERLRIAAELLRECKNLTAGDLFARIEEWELSE